MFTKILMFAIASTMIAFGTAAYANVPPQYLHTNMLGTMPEWQLNEASEHAVCPLTGVAHSPDGESVYLFDWAHPRDSQAARKGCARPAPVPGMYDTIG